MNVLLYKQLEREILELDFEIDVIADEIVNADTTTTTSISTRCTNAASNSSAAAPIFKCGSSISFAKGATSWSAENSLDQLTHKGGHDGQRESQKQKYGSSRTNQRLKHHSLSRSRQVGRVWTNSNPNAPPTIGGVENQQAALPHHNIAQARDFVRLHPDEENYWSHELCFVNVPIKGQKQDLLHLIDEDLALAYLPSGKIQRFRLVLATKPHDVFFLCSRANVRTRTIPGMRAT